jgi:hypothetical protein
MLGTSQETNMFFCSTGFWPELDMNPEGSETAICLQANADTSAKLKIVLHASGVTMSTF